MGGGRAVPRGEVVGVVQTIDDMCASLLGLPDTSGV